MAVNKLGTWNKNKKHEREFYDVIVVNCHAGNQPPES